MVFIEEEVLLSKCVVDEDIMNLIINLVEVFYI